MEDINKVAQTRQPLHFPKFRWRRKEQEEREEKAGETVSGASANIVKESVGSTETGDLAATPTTTDTTWGRRTWSTSRYSSSKLSQDFNFFYYQIREAFKNYLADFFR